MSDTKTILVTGASRGIGLAISRQLQKEGHDVIGLARSFDTNTSSADHARTFAIDFSKLESLPEKLQEIKKSVPAPNVLVLSAGAGHFGSLEEFSYQQIQSSMDLNFFSQAFVLRCFLPEMKKAKQGHVIVMGSESARQGARLGSLYCASKFALRGLAQSLREECSRAGIHVTIINPGMVRSGFFEDLDFTHGDEQENYVLPEDVASTVSTILSLKPGTVVDEINLSPLKKVIKSKKGG